MNQRKKIILIGGGFAGMEFAKKLSNKKEFDILLLDKQNHHMFQPLFYQVACSMLDVNSIIFPFRKVFQGVKNMKFRMAEVTEVDSEKKIVITNIGEFEYDYLVLGFGCTTNFFGNNGLAEHALTLKSTEEATQMHYHILTNFEKALNAKTEDELEKHLNIVIVGGGATGVELAGSLAEMRNKILPKDYTFFDFSQLKIHLIEGANVILGPMSENAHRKSELYLNNLGVNIKKGMVVSDYDGEIATLSNGEKIPTYNLIWSAGVTSNQIAGLHRAEYVRGNRIKVNRFNKVENYDNVFAIGDIAYMETPKYPKGHPQLANVAKNQGKLLAKNLLKNCSFENWKEYEYKDLGSMATIGKNKAVVDLPRLKFSGFFAWLTWMFVHLMLILTVKNKMIILINWATSYFSSDSSLRSILKHKNTSFRWK
jgi:NADH dehydrogenase